MIRPAYGQDTLLVPRHIRLMPYSMPGWSTIKFSMFGHPRASEPVPVKGHLRLDPSGSGEEMLLGRTAPLPDFRAVYDDRRTFLCLGWCIDDIWFPKAGEGVAAAKWHLVDTLGCEELDAARYILGLPWAEDIRQSLNRRYA